jgi:hypothetical protein
MRKHTTAQPRMKPGRVTKIAPGVYLAHSDNGPHAYEVHLDGPQGASCACMDFIKRGHLRPCKHILRAQAHSYGMAIQKARRMAQEEGTGVLVALLSRGQYRPEVTAAIRRAIEEGQEAPLTITCHTPQGAQQWAEAA